MILERSVSTLELLKRPCKFMSKSLSGAENSGESQMRLRDMQKRTLKRPEFVESAPKYRQRTEITVFMRSLIYQGFQDFCAPLRCCTSGPRRFFPSSSSFPKRNLNQINTISLARLYPNISASGNQQVVALGRVPALNLPTFPNQPGCQA
jgi:hypothetical protein